LENAAARVRKRPSITTGASNYGESPTFENTTAVGSPRKPATFQRQRITSVKQNVIPPPFTQNCNTILAPSRKVFPSNQLTFRKTTCHMPDAPPGYSVAHAVDQTLQMSAGIAVDFKNGMGQIPELKARNKKVG
jgi:hypothetical protein